MSSHCHRYPNCECPSTCGRYCGSNESTEQIKSRNAAHKADTTDGVPRDDNGFPLLPDGSIDWALTSKEKSAMAEKYDRQERIALGRRAKPHRKYPTNYTPPKKKRK